MARHVYSKLCIGKRDMSKAPRLNGSANCEDGVDSGIVILKDVAYALRGWLIFGSSRY